MKKVSSLLMLFFVVFYTNAQTNNVPVKNASFDYKLINTCAAIFTLCVLTAFILMVLKRWLEYSLKNKIIDKGIPESVAIAVLQTTAQEEKNINLKWFALLAGAAAGLTIVYYTQPLGIHSLAIMCFACSISFLGYYFFLRRTTK